MKPQWTVHKTMSATRNCEHRLGVTWGPDPDWDLLTSVWASTDTHGLNLYPLTSCCVQKHLRAPCIRSARSLDRSRGLKFCNKRTRSSACKGYQTAYCITLLLSYLEILISIHFSFHKRQIDSEKHTITTLTPDLDDCRAVTAFLCSNCSQKQM